MNLEEAHSLTRKFIRHGTEFTPQLTDDWTFSISPNRYDYDSICIDSRKLNVTIHISMTAQWFFDNYISKGKLKTIQDKIIGEYSFTKDNLIEKDVFNEATELALSVSGEAIENEDLLEDAIYIDDKGRKFVYLGDISYSLHSFYNGFEKSVSPKNKMRYIAFYDPSYEKTIIQKTKRIKFVKFVGFLSSKEKKTFTISLLNARHNSLFLRHNYNKIEYFIDIPKIINPFKNTSDLIFYNEKYGQLSVKNEKFIFEEIDFTTFLKDPLSNIDDFKIGSIEKIEAEYGLRFRKVFFFTSYS